MKKVLIISFISALLFVACSPSAKLARLQKKHPELFPDTVVVSGSVDDTAVSIFDLDLKTWKHEDLDIFGTKEDSVRWFQRKSRISVLVIPETISTDSGFIIPQAGGSGKATISITEGNRLHLIAKPEARKIPYVAKVPVIPKVNKIGYIQVFLIGLGILFVALILLIVIRKFF